MSVQVQDLGMMEFVVFQVENVLILFGELKLSMLCRSDLLVIFRKFFCVLTTSRCICSFCPSLVTLPLIYSPKTH